MTAQRALAITGARLFDDTGAPPLEPANVVIEDGRISADVVVVDGDPLVDVNATRNLVTVVKDGVRYEPQDLLDRVTT